MTIDEAIKHCKEKAGELRTEAEQLRDIGEVISSPKQPYNEPVKVCRECAKEHEQLAEWLKELKTLKERPQGEWIEKHSDYGVYYRCSICHKMPPNYECDYKEGAIKTNFCPNCGAKMKGGEEE